jgi:hypothetical protein
VRLSFRTVQLEPGLLVADKIRHTGYSLKTLVPTVEAKLLLGWMPRTEALDFLLNKCVFDTPLQEAEALTIWNGYKEKGAALGSRKCTIPDRQKLSMPEKIAVSKLKKNPPKMQDRLHDVLKIDPNRCVIHQFYVVTERSAAYVSMMTTTRPRIKFCFGQDQQVPTIEDRGALRIIRLPHFEYDLEQRPLPNGTTNLNLQEWPRLIVAVELKDRLLLWGGYHRTYALLSQAEPDGLVAPPLVSLITNRVVDAFFSNASTRPEVRDGVLGDRPAFFCDFFDDDLCMRVQLRKQERQVRIDSASNALSFGYFDAES